ncbi:hypothetical protein F4780DRAFT_20342 [Xylariomycetidae sp. FL0641]|nr:hypothetical protein F4780DRAFT_20342 [Xylariomycetidae sp. FL0641]
MVTINLAYTAPINPAGSAPVLNQAQVWAGLEKKVRRAQDFVPVIEACAVLAETTLPSGDLQVQREVRFRGREEDPVHEVCTHFAPCRVVFEQKDGSTITNVISKGREGELLMSYVFEWRHPQVVEGSEEAGELEQQHWKTAKMAVESSIDTIRRMVQEGTIQ